MGNPFLYLALCTLRNRWRVRLRRLREPRYLIGMIAAVLYFYFMLFRQGRGSRGGLPAFMAWTAQNLEPVVIVASIVLCLLAALPWFLPAGKGLLFGLTASEVQFLVPAPVSRRRVIRFQVLRAQLGLLFGSAFMTLLFRPGSLLRSVMFFVGVVGVLMLVTLYGMTVNATRARLAQPDSAAPALAAGRHRRWRRRPRRRLVRDGVGARRRERQLS